VPAISAFAIIGITQGRAGIVAYLRRLLHWRAGWVGFALPLLQRRHSGLWSAVILGFLGMPWHVPGLFVETVMTYEYWTHLGRFDPHRTFYIEHRASRVKVALARLTGAVLGRFVA
jgi:hypothetical protein